MKKTEVFSITMSSFGLLRFLVPLYLFLVVQSTLVSNITDGADRSLLDICSNFLKTALSHRISFQNDASAKIFDSNLAQDSNKATDLVPEDAFSSLLPQSLALVSRSLTSRSLKKRYICGVYDHQSTVVGHSIFFMGGLYKVVEDGEVITQGLTQGEHV